MKTFELTMKLKNNLIKKRRLELGLSPRQASEAAGVSYSLWLAYEAMTETPLSGDRRRKGYWRKSAESVARFLGVPVAELFPEAVLLVVSPEQTREIDAEEMLALGEMQRESSIAQLPLPDEAVDKGRAKLALATALGTLRPLQERVLKWRFEEDLTLEEIAERLGVGRERVRQIENKALRMLRHPSRVKVIGEFRP